MQTNQPTYRFAQTGNQPQRTAPGLKMTYGSKAQQPQTQFQTPVTMQKAAPASQNSGLFGRLKEKIWHMVTEEATTDRPIGIAQLTQKTFQPHPNSAFFRQGSMQDYRFPQLIDPK